MLAATTVVGVLAVATISWFLASRVQDALYDQRVSEALADALIRTDQIQTQFDASTATTPAQVTDIAASILRTSQSPDSGAISIICERRQWRTRRLAGSTSPWDRESR